MKNIYVTKPYLPSKKTFINYMSRIWDSSILTNKGPLYNELKGKISNMINNDNVCMFCNGHLALETAIKSLSLAKGEEVITTPYTFVSTTHAIVNNGLVPVFCDIKMSDYTIDETKIEDLITDKTVAIVAVHVYGYPCNVEELSKICKKHNLKLIFDAAHAFGVEYKNRSILNYGDVSMVSFHATKLFNTIEGGLLVSNKNELTKQQEILQNFGIIDAEHVNEIGYNAKMNEFCAAMGLSTIDDLPKIIAKRKKLVSLYNSLLYKIDGITVRELNDDVVKNNYAYYPIVVDEKKYGMTRDELQKLLEQYNVFSRKYFYPLTSDMKCYNEKFPEFKKANVPNAKYVSDRVLTLPLYYSLKESEIRYICNIIRSKH